MADTNTGPIVVRPGEAGTEPMAEGAFELLADGGAVSASRLTLASGTDGAPPHQHRLSHEIFYVLEGTLVFRLGDSLSTVGKGGLVIIPPGLTHAFGAVEGAAADVVILLSPGIERFAYFARLAAISRGEETFESLLPVQDRFDVHLVDLADWRSAP